METQLPETRSHCGYCGHRLADGTAAPERFGERFCSEAHAEEFVVGARTARMQAVARRESQEVGACALPPAGQRSWNAYLKRGLCWGAPLLLLLALPLIWSGGWASAGGSLLSVLALLACPLGMYFMMRAMTGMQRPDRRKEPERGKGDSDA